jgi:hypothetical protein
MVKAIVLSSVLLGWSFAVDLRACTVSAYVDADVVTSPGLVWYAVNKTTELFRLTGVDVQIARRKDSYRAPADSCGPPIRILIEHGGRRSAGKNVLANTTPYRGMGSTIHVYLDRIVTAGPLPATGTVLAYVFAHEITHLVEGIDRHSDSGILKAFWSKEDYKRIRDFKLTFDARDVEMLRDRMARLKLSGGPQMQDQTADSR